MNVAKCFKVQKLAFLDNFETLEDIWIKFYRVITEISFSDSTEVQGLWVTGETTVKCLKILKLLFLENMFITLKCRKMFKNKFYIVKAEISLNDSRGAHVFSVNEGAIEE